MNQIKMSYPKVSLINCVNTPPNPPSNSMLEIPDSGANIHLTKQGTTKTTLVIMPTEMTEILQDGSTMEYSYIATLQLPSLIKRARQIHIFPKMKPSPLVLLVVLRDDGCTITLDKQKMSF